MKLALDTNRYTDLMHRQADVVHIVEAADEIMIPFAVLAELRFGFRYGTKADANLRVLTAFLQRPAVRASFPDDETIVVYAELANELRRIGRMIPNNDLWIAALCVQHGFALYTRGRHFEHLKRLPRA